MLFFYIASALVTIATLLILYFKWTFTYWKRKGVTTLEPSIPFGNAGGFILRKCHMGEMWTEAYVEYKRKGLQYGGHYFLTSKFFIPVDPRVIKNILQNDFEHFMDHGFYVSEEVDPLTGHLFALESTKWKNLRTKLTPTFTSGKMKVMFETLTNCADKLKIVMDKDFLDKGPVDVKEILGRFTIDVIASCAFGIECNSLEDPESEFHKYGKLFFHESIMDILRNFLQFIAPDKLLHFIKLKMIDPQLTNFFLDIVRKTVDYREKNKVYRKDFMHLLIQLKNRGRVTDDGKITEEDEKVGEIGLSINQIAAQAFAFFIAGFETSSTTMTFALFEIASNSKIQSKLRQEIKSVLQKHDNQLIYDTIMELTYMDKVINETLRKYPPFPALPRICTKTYMVPKTNLKIDKGIQVIIPTLGIHHDPEFYPNPEQFDPERFTAEAIAARPSHTWLPFGEGPRKCIGQRFGLMQIKVGLATLLSNYQISINKKTVVPLELDIYGFIIGAKGRVWIDFEKI